MSPECDETGERCALMQIELDPDNIDAWNLYQDIQSLGDAALAFWDLRLTEEDAEVMLAKMRKIAETRAQIELDRIKKARQDAAHQGGRFGR